MFIVLVSYALLIITLPLSLLFSLRVIANCVLSGLRYSVQFVTSNEKLVVLRLGRAQRTRGSGAALVLPCIGASVCSANASKFIAATVRRCASHRHARHRLQRATHEHHHTGSKRAVTSGTQNAQDRGLVEMGAIVYLRVRDAIAAVCQVQVTD